MQLFGLGFEIAVMLDVQLQVLALLGYFVGQSESLQVELGVLASGG